MRSVLFLRVPAWATVVALTAAVAAISAVSVALHKPPGDAAAGPAQSGIIHVPLWVDPAKVRHQPRFYFTYDPPEALAALRSQEKLDRVIEGADNDLDRFRRLNAWTRAQFEPGVPSPYPPPDARIILRDVRSGFTGGFCAQYNFVLVQALQSLGYRARCVSLSRHEVVEAWARDARRWIGLDPIYAATYVDESGRELSVYEVNARERRGAPLLAGPGSRPETEEEMRGAFGRFEVWIKNDHVSRPVNFTDLPRYRVRFIHEGEWAPDGAGLSTRDIHDLYFDPDES